MRLNLKTSLLTVLLMAASAAGEQRAQTYLVELNGEPMAELARPSLARTAHAGARLAAIRGEQATVGRAVTRAGARVLTSVDNVMNGLLVRADAETAARLRGIPGVRAVYADCGIEFKSDKAMEMNGIAEAWQWMGGRDTAGEGVKVAVLDTGIVPDHPAFQDKTMKPPPGYPKAYPPQNLAFTNGKIIVIRNFNPLINFREPTAADDISDTAGHGTAVASVIAGVPHQTPYGFFSGVAPKAWIGLYVVSGGTTIV
jgi:subtilisin family serine protease